MTYRMKTLLAAAVLALAATQATIAQVFISLNMTTPL